MQKNVGFNPTSIGVGFNPTPKKLADNQIADNIDADCRHDDDDGWDLTQHLNDEEEAEEEKKKKEDEHEDEDEIAAEDDDDRSGRRRIQMKMQMGSQAIRVGLNPTPKQSGLDLTQHLI